MLATEHFGGINVLGADARDVCRDRCPQGTRIPLGWCRHSFCVAARWSLRGTDGNAFADRLANLTDQWAPDGFDAYNEGLATFPSEEFVTTYKATRSAGPDRRAERRRLREVVQRPPERRVR